MSQENQIEKRRGAWFASALSRELAVIEGFPENLNIYKPESGFFTALLKIASLSKGGGIEKETALLKVKYACRHMRLRGKDIDYQWKRAYDRAKPRTPQL